MGHSLPMGYNPHCSLNRCGYTANHHAGIGIEQFVDILTTKRRCHLVLCVQTALNGNLPSDFDHRVRRQPEIFAQMRGIALHHYKTHRHP